MTGSQRTLVMVVGRDSPVRQAVGIELIRRGYPVVMCSGPPGCSLSHEDRCALLDQVNIAVLLPAVSDCNAGLYLQECARQAQHAIFAHAPDFAMPPGAVVAESSSATAIADAVSLTRQGGSPEGWSAAPSRRLPPPAA